MFVLAPSGKKIIERVGRTPKRAGGSLPAIGVVGCEIKAGAPGVCPAAEA